jgi:hypothetical protein
MHFLGDIFMNSFQSWQQEKYTAQIKHHRSWLIPAVASILVPCYVLGTDISSAVAQTASILRTDGRVTLWKNGEQVNAMGQTMRQRRDILSVAGRSSAWANITIRGCDATGGRDLNHSYYNFPNEYQNKWTIGMNQSKECRGFLLRLLENESAQLPQTKQTKFPTNAIQVLQVGDIPTVVQTDQQNDADGRKLVVDVLLGAVTINSPQRQGQLLQAGQRYIYFVDARRDAVQEGIGRATDCDAVNLFLELNNWPENIRPRINLYQPARKLCEPILR